MHWDFRGLKPTQRINYEDCTEQESQESRQAIIPTQTTYHKALYLRRLQETSQGVSKGTGVLGWTHCQVQILPDRWQRQAASSYIPRVAVKGGYVILMLMVSFLWLAASIGLTVGSVLIIDAVIFFGRKPCE
jgi:hypothetical protein